MGIARTFWHGHGMPPFFKKQGQCTVPVLRPGISLGLYGMCTSCACVHCAENWGVQNGTDALLLHALDIHGGRGGRVASLHQECYTMTARTKFVCGGGGGGGEVEQ